MWNRREEHKFISEAIEMANIEMLTDEQCNEFRRMNCSFNDMVRAIYKAGYEHGITDMESLVLMQMDYAKRKAGDHTFNN
jgi:predicted double-glycine peptidase